MAGISLTDPRRSQLIELLTAQQARPRQIENPIQLLAELGAQAIRQSQVNKLRREELGAENASNRRISDVLAGTEGRQNIDIANLEGGFDTVSAPDKRGAEGRQRQATRVSALRPNERATAAGLRAAERELADPTQFEQRQMLQQGRQEFAAEQAHIVRGFQSSQAELDRAHRGRQSELTRNATAEQRDLDRQLTRELAQQEQDFALKISELKNSGAGGLKLTQDQANATAFSVRAEDSSSTLDAFSGSGTDFFDRLWPLAPNGWKTVERQKFEQAERNFINATLRRESGATISDAEFANAREQYIPQPGDSDEVQAQKRENRVVIFQALKLASGGGYDALRAEIPRPTFGGDKAQPTGAGTADDPIIIN